jgi:ABC-type uncharacterized transport system ATPase subunit
MIESLHIAKAATYGLTSQPMVGLAKLNFFFGMNGAGKTTISRLIEKPSLFPASGLVRCTVNSGHRRFKQPARFF